MWCRLVLTFCLGYVYANEYSHKYIVDEDVTLWVNKVGPYHNPQETYVYYSLPFCSTKPIDQLEHRWDGLGEVLEGNDLVNSGIPFRYREPTKEYTKVTPRLLLPLPPPNPAPPIAGVHCEARRVEDQAACVRRA